MQQTIELLHNPSFLESFPTAVYVIDEQGLIRSFNKKACEYWGRTPKLLNHDYKYCGCFKLFLPDGSYMPHDQTPMVTALEEGTEFRNCEVIIEHEDGKRVAILVNISPIRDENQKIVGAINVFQDVSEVVAARKKLREQKRDLEDRDTYLALCSHELKTPLTSLILETSMAAKKLDHNDDSVFEKERIKKMIHNSQHQLERLNRLVDDMLDIHRMKTGKLNMNFESIDIAALVRTVVASNVGSDGELNKQVKLKTSSAIVGEYDRIRIEQVITNLFTNAIKYGDGKGVSINIETIGTSVLIQFCDNGIGISEENQSRVFERFERAVDSEVNIKGLGLGLYITKQIIEAHQGKIDLYSELGKGSTFSVVLPLLQ